MDELKNTEDNMEKPKEESLSTILIALSPLIQLFVENQNKNLEMKNKLLEKNAEISTNDIHFQKYKFTRLFWFSVIISICLFVISFGLIFFKDQVNSGLLVISHIVALVSGVLAGIGIEKNRSNMLYEEQED